MASRYQIVCMVVDCGSLKGAADELGYTQSAVSQAVKALERELGTTIIERGKQGVSLTRSIIVVPSSRSSAVTAWLTPLCV